MRLPKAIPRRMPTAWVLKHIAFPPRPEQLQPTLTLDNHILPPRISYRNQARIRKACVLADIDPALSLGIPARPVSKYERRKNNNNNNNSHNNSSSRHTELVATGLQDLVTGNKNETRKIQRALERAEAAAGQDAVPTYDRVVKKVTLPKGSKRDIKAVERELKIKANMEKMEDTIAAWREEKRKAKLAAKPEMPF